ncbi:hypothetical protein NC651_017175 [Populus alba x Populus x berolinensis]|nr:hypothetical protein NC651_017175 [Populus alba x Populus x berolinensis]
MLEGQFGHRNSGCQKTIRPLIFWTHMCFGGSTVNVNKANKTKVVREKEESSRNTTRTFEFGRTHVVRPKGKHQATIVWLHGLGDKGSSWSQLLETLPLPNIKWICPTAPTRPVAIFGSDVGDISEDAPDDLEGLDASAAHVANLLSTEPADIKLGVGGFSMGAATALYSATCRILGQYGNGNPYPVNLSAIVGLSGWLPCSRTLRNRIERSDEAARRAASLPILLCHGSGLAITQSLKRWMKFVIG